MQARGVWFGNSRWPSGASPGAFARDVFRLEGCVTDRDKALALNRWLVRCMNRGPNLKLPSMGGFVHCADPTLLFTSWGHNECTGWGFVATEALQAAGLKARRAVINNSGHTIFEVWYKGLDGREGWHVFDPFLGWYLLNDAGELPSCDELAANPDWTIHPRPGGRSRQGHHPERSKAQIYPFRTGDNLDVIQPVQGYELRYEPRPGQVYSNLWRPEVPELAARDPGAIEGAHCDIPLYDHEGRPTYPEHLPYWKNYVWPTADTSTNAGGQPVRWQGSGALRWNPLQHGAGEAWSAAHAVFENGTVRTAGCRTHCEVWWHVKVPHLISWLRLQSNFEVEGGELIGLAISADAGRSLHPLHWKAAPPPPLLTVGPGDVPGVRNLQEFWLRLDMSSQHREPKLRCRVLQISVGYQLNMNVLPRLLPGANELSLEAEHNDGLILQTDWAWSQGQDERVESLVLDPGGKVARRIVNPGASRPEDLHMRGVTLRCLPAR